MKQEQDRLMFQERQLSSTLEHVEITEHMSELRVV